MGHPARLVEAVQKHSLDALLSRLDSASILSDVRGDLEAAMVCEMVIYDLCDVCGMFGVKPLFIGEDMCTVYPDQTPC